jgi:hypothetical protein
VLPGLGRVSMQRVGQYTPAVWAAQFEVKAGMRVRRDKPACCRG